MYDTGDEISSPAPTAIITATSILSKCLPQQWPCMTYF